MISKLLALPSRLFNALTFNRIDSNVAEIVKGASSAFVLKVIGAGLAFVFNVVLARILGADGAGIYFLALSVASIAAVFGRMGLDNAMLRFISGSAATGKWREVKGVYLKGIKLALLASTLSAFSMFLIAPLASGFIFKKPALTVPIRWMSLAVVPMVLTLLHAQAVKGVKRISAAVFVQSVSIPAFSLISVPLLAHFWGIIGAVWAYTLATTCTMISGMFFWISFTPQLKLSSGSFETRRLFNSSIPLFWVAFMNLLMNWTSTVMLGIWGTSSDVGVYGVAHRTAFLTSLILVAVNSIAAPKFAEFHKKGDLRSLAHTAQFAAKLTTLMATPVLALFLLAPRWIMKIFGSAFADGGLLLSILAGGQFINVITGSVGFLLMMCGYEHLMRNNAAFAATVNVVLNCLLTPKWGALGAALSTAVSLATMNLAATLLVWWRMKIWTLPFMASVQNTKLGSQRGNPAVHNDDDY